MKSCRWSWTRSCWKKKSVKKLHSLERDRQTIAAEKQDIAARLAEVEKVQEEDLFSQKIRKARGRLRLSSSG